MLALLVDARAPEHDEAPPRPAPQGSGAPRVRYMPGLDGLRAIAVIAVILYHCQIAFFEGGFLGVEVFFVISGYLITALLIAERRNKGRINLKQFWVRRARRLLPALFAVLIAVAVYASFFLRDDLSRLRGDILAALTYSTNWWLIFGQRSYFETIGAPPLLKHLWSLAIEEQFYLLWPFIFTGLMFLTDGNRKRVLAILGAGSVASVVSMWLFANPDHPDRVYMGTDTRASSLLLGAMLAFVWSPWLLSKKVKRQASTVLDISGVAALAVIVVCFHFMSQTTAFLYPGGFLITSLATCVAIAVVVHPASRIVRPLVGLAPLRWVGVRSYGLYLWNWPIVAITDTQRGFPFTGVTQFVIRVVLTVAFAEVSYRFLEQPIRTGSWRTTLASVRAQLSNAKPERAKRARRSIAITSVVVGCVLVFTAVSLVTAKGGESALERQVLNGRSSIALRATTTVAPDAVAASTTPAVPPPPRVTAIGDSVMLGAADALLADLGDVYVDAKKSRQFNEVFGIVEGLRAEQKLSPVVVVHLGTNGRITPDAFDKLMQELSDRESVIVVTTRVPRSWEGPNNDIIVSEAAKFKNVTVLDWHGYGNSRGDLFYQDAIHLRQPDGANYYAGLIRDKVPPPPPPTTTAPPTTAKSAKR
ncbi:MAG: acyltransferase family protein [Acidimicrobiia bacterium]